jgi:hypothetical protein
MMKQSQDLLMSLHVVYPANYKNEVELSESTLNVEN